MFCHGRFRGAPAFTNAVPRRIILINQHKELPMNDRELTGNVNSSMYRQCRDRDHAAPVSVLRDYENKRNRRLSYLERFCLAPLSKQSPIINQMMSYAKKTGEKPPLSYYKWPDEKKKSKRGRKTANPPQFSMNCLPEDQRLYAPHLQSRSLSRRLWRRKKQSRRVKAGLCRRTQVPPTHSTHKRRRAGR